jgi:hypothetical protein
MKRSRLPSLAFAGVLACTCAPAFAEEIYVKLKGFEEVPAISSTARGSFAAKINTSDRTIVYRLKYDGLQGDVLQAHIHFGARSTNGGVGVFLCQTVANPDPTGLAPTCPQSGQVRAVIRAANVIGPGAQGISAGEFDELVKAIRSGVAYVNVHSTTFASGELRGQLNGPRNLLGF